MPPEPHIRRGLPQPVQAGMALLGLAVSAPLFFACAAAVRLSSAGPILFRQERIGRRGKPFTLYKFRTMLIDRDGAQVTATGDRRVTAVGAVLRKTKLDELPELWNVLNGTMALVGPRPEVPRYVDLGDPLWAAVLQVRPGITSPMAVHLRDEEAVMAGVEPERRERFYVDTLMRYKLLSHLEYLQQRTPVTDLTLLAQTALAILARRAAHQPTPEEVESTVRRAERSG